MVDREDLDAAVESYEKSRKYRAPSRGGRTSSKLYSYHEMKDRATIDLSKLEVEAWSWPPPPPNPKKGTGTGQRLERRSHHKKKPEGSV